MHSFDIRLLAATAIVWALLAIAYATIEMIAMPAAASVWGAGALVFILLVAATTAAERRGDRRSQ